MLKKHLYLIKTVLWIFTISFINITFTGCFNLVNGRTGNAPDSSGDEYTFPTNILLDNLAELSAKSDQSSQTPLALATTSTVTAEPKLYQIDLPSALRLASAQNYKIALAIEKIAEASALHDQAKTLLLPSLTVGASYYRQDGQLQETGGAVGDVDRSAGYAGLGAGAVGAGAIQVPGVSLTADLSSALFEPLAAQQNAYAAKAGARAVTNQVLLDVIIAYYELVRAKAALSIAEEARDNAADLAQITGSFARTGEGLESDAERASVELLIRENGLLKARQAVQVRSAKLAELLHLDATVQLDPSAENVMPIHLVPQDRPLTDIVSEALRNHPEVKQQQALVDAAFLRFSQTKYRPLFPKVGLNFSTGEFSGGSNSSLDDAGSRSGFNAMIYWQFNFGDKARTNRQRSQYRQTQLEQLGAYDHIASEVTQSYAYLEALKKQISPCASAVERALLSLQLNRARVYEKQGLPIEVLQALQSLEITRRLYLNTVIDYNQAQYRLYTALGQPPSEVSSKTN